MLNGVFITSKPAHNQIAVINNAATERKTFSGSLYVAAAPKAAKNKPVAVKNALAREITVSSIRLYPLWGIKQR